MPDLLTVDEVADLFRVTANSVRAWCRQNRIPHIVLPNGQFRFRKADVEEYLYISGENF